MCVRCPTIGCKAHSGLSFPSASLQTGVLSPPLEPRAIGLNDCLGEKVGIPQHFGAQWTYYTMVLCDCPVLNKATLAFSVRQDSRD